MPELTLTRLLLLLAATLLPAAAIAWAVGLLVRMVAPRFGLVDRPTAGHKAHSAPTPLGGGIAVLAGVATPLVAGAVMVFLFPEPPAWAPEWVAPHWDGLRSRLPQLGLLLSGGAVLLMVGLIDDLRGLSWPVKLAAQFLVATACLLAADWQLTAFLPFAWLGLALSVLWIVAIVNAFNMLDNMDGLSGGVAAIAASCLAATLLLGQSDTAMRPQWFVAGLLLVVVGSLLGFLVHNRPPAKLFLGDAGSYFIGFLLAVAALLGTHTDYSAGRPHAVLAPLCLLAVPLYDLVSVVCIRLSQGRSPFHPDRNHFSHRLVALGFSRPAAVGMIWLATLICGLAALLLPELNGVRAAAVGLMILCLLAFIALLEWTARNRGE